MPDAQKDPEIEALQKIHAALKPLTAEVRGRVIASVQVLLGMQPADPGFEEREQPGKRETPAGEPLGRTRAGSKDRPTSIGELVSEKSPRTNTQYIVLFAYYRDRFQGLTRFGRDDLKQLFSAARKKPPKNYSRDFNETVKRGWIHEDGADSYITSKGMEVVESGFQGPPRPKPKGSRKAAHKTASKK